MMLTPRTYLKTMCNTADKAFYVCSISVLLSFFGKGICDSICPNGIVNITGSTTGTLVYPSSGNYGINETKCWRIEVPKPYTGIGIYFHSFDIEECKDCDCDKLTYSSSYFGITRNKAKCARRTSRFQEARNMQYGDARPEDFEIGRDIWFRFVSDDTVFYKGFNLSYIVRSETPSSGFTSVLNATEGETFEIGTPKVVESKKYPESFEWEWYLIVPEGRQVQLTFEIFELEQSTDCENDYLEVREAISLYPYLPLVSFDGRYGSILSKPVCGTNKPSTIKSSGNMVWVHFKSDSNTTTTYRGFKASFKAGQGRLSILHPMALLFLSALLMAKSKDSLF
ncbi:tolloid-like protein 2 [Porites lutea]|uniref:tolloid-like protein 2 n=1 Tax=Porites lutea TaxID=51062 RepID=UPI003CC68745